MQKRELIDGHVVEVTDDGRLFVDEKEYSEEFDNWPVTTSTLVTAVQYHEENA